MCQQRTTEQSPLPSLISSIHPSVRSSLTHPSVHLSIQSIHIDNPSLASRYSFLPLNSTLQPDNISRYKPSARALARTHARTHACSGKLHSSSVIAAAAVSLQQRQYHCSSSTPACSVAVSQRYSVTASRRYSVTAVPGDCIGVKLFLCAVYTAT